MSSTTAHLTTFGAPPATLTVGDFDVCRLGFGAMQLPGKGVWGEPEDPERVASVLRRVVALGINFIDSSWYYGPHVANRLIKETLYPYPKDLVIASKLGGKRTPDKGWAPFSRPEELREGCEHDLRGLGREILIAYLPFFPLAIGTLSRPQPALDAAAKRHNATPAQIAIAWLLARSPVMLPIPGTSSPEHLEENWGARRIALSQDEVAAIAAGARAALPGA